MECVGKPHDLYGILCSQRAMGEPNTHVDISLDLTTLASCPPESASIPGSQESTRLSQEPVRKTTERVKTKRLKVHPRICRTGVLFWRKRNKRASRCRTAASKRAASSPAQGSPQGTGRLIPGLSLHGLSRSRVWASGLWTQRAVLLDLLFGDTGRKRTSPGVECSGANSMS